MKDMENARLIALATLALRLLGTRHRSKSVRPVNPWNPNYSSRRRDCALVHFTDKEIESQRCKE